MEIDRKKEVINVCLDHFIDKGLSETSTRSLSSALKLQNAGLYYYFATKDETVVLCAEEAVWRLENSLISPAIKDIGNPNLMMKRLQSRADEMTPTMQFLASVCVNNKYKDDMWPALDRLSQRYNHYTEMFASALKCQKVEIRPYLYLTISAIANYMVFGETSLFEAQMGLVKQKIEMIMNSNQDGDGLVVKEA